MSYIPWKAVDKVTPSCPMDFALLVQPLYPSAADYDTNLVVDQDDLGIEGPKQSAFAALRKVLASAPQYHIQPTYRKLVSSPSIPTQNWRKKAEI